MISQVPEMLKLCNKDALAYPFEGSPDTVPPLFSMLDSSQPPHWSSELAREPLPPQACSLGAGLEGTKIFLQATNVKGGSGLKKLSQGQCPLCLAWEMGTWAFTSPVPT